MKKVKLIIGFSILPFIGMSQSTTATNTQNGNQDHFIGFTNNFPLFVRTANIPRAQFTTGVALSSFTSDFGDGLRILPPPGNTGNLDLFTSGTNGQNETHARFGGSGIVSGQRNRFEVMSTSQMGMFYNTTQGSGIHRF